MPRDEATIQALRRDMALQVSRVARRLGNTQVAAARKLGVPQPTLSKISNGHVSDLSIEFLLRVAVRAGLPIALQTGRDAKEAGAFISGVARDGTRVPRSKLAKEARESLGSFERRLTPSERLEAFLEHNQLLGEIHQSGRVAEKRRLHGASTAK